MDLKNGEHVAGEFIGRLQMADTQSEIPRIRSYNIWAVGLHWKVQFQLRDPRTDVILGLSTVD